MPLFGERCELKKRIAAKSAPIDTPSGRLRTKYVLIKKPARDGMRRPAASKKPAASNARVVARSFKTKSPPRKPFFANTYDFFACFQGSARPRTFQLRVLRCADDGLT